MFNIMFCGHSVFTSYLLASFRGELMPYAAGHRVAVRKRIVDSARRLFNRYGFDNVSIGQIMGGANLTHGGFYSYFKSKSDLYAEVLGCFFTDPNWKNCWEGVHVDLTSTDVGKQVVRAYLSRQHFENVEDSCPMVALPSYVARRAKNVKRAFETVFKAMVSVLERSLLNKKAPSHARAQAIAALCVGGMVVARSVDDRALSDELRDACMFVALRLGGWNNAKNSKAQPKAFSKQNSIPGEQSATRKPTRHRDLTPFDTNWKKGSGATPLRIQDL